MTWGLAFHGRFVHGVHSIGLGGAQFGLSAPPYPARLVQLNTGSKATAKPRETAGWHDRRVPTVERRQDLAARRLERALHDVGEEIREARRAAGLSQAEVARHSSMSHAQVSRIERAQLRHASLADLVAVSTVVGLDLSVRAYPGARPVRDAAHLALLTRLRERLAPTLVWRTEVPLSLHRDARAWDAVISRAGRPIGVEAETRLRDVQAVERRISLKLRDGGIERVVLLLADTRTNREAVRADPDRLRSMFPVPQRDLLRALATGADPCGSGVVIL
ncbi:MAG TPA: helix-turn-helix domain-containing protein [Candidatus Limnocylindrales bacterium]|nr:helix-turn-helix domain-containing protein [Candidatus Limnocylindrales bacterium]